MKTDESHIPVAHQRNFPLYVRPRMRICIIALDLFDWLSTLNMEVRSHRYTRTSIYRHCKLPLAVVDERWTKNPKTSLLKCDLRKPNPQSIPIGPNKTPLPPQWILLLLFFVYRLSRWLRPFRDWMLYDHHEALQPPSMQKNPQWRAPKPCQRSQKTLLLS